MFLLIEASLIIVRTSDETMSPFIFMKLVLMLALHVTQFEVDLPRTFS
ncbi:MAG: hypothetical protein OJF50_000585 [Nitrospira sp.]|nr:hypothetical protein [Nitrospira sp.]